VPVPQTTSRRAAKRRVGDRGGERAGPFGREVPAADVAQVFLGVAVFTGGDRSQADVGAVAEDAQDQPLGQHRGVDPRPGTGRREVLQQADPQHRFLEHVQQRHQPPPGTDLRLQPVQVPGFRCRIQRGQGDLTAPAGADLQPRQARQRLLQRLQFGGHLPAQRVDELVGGQRLRQLRVIRPAAVLEVGGQVLLRVAPSVRAFRPDLFAAQPFPQSAEQAHLVDGAQHPAVRRFTAVGQIDPVAVHDARDRHRLVLGVGLQLTVRVLQDQGDPGDDRLVRAVVRPERQRLQQFHHPAAVMVGVGAAELDLHVPAELGSVGPELGHHLPQRLRAAGDREHHVPHRSVRPIQTGLGDLAQQHGLVPDPLERSHHLLGHPPVRSGVDRMHRGDQQLHQRVDDLPLPLHQRPAHPPSNDTGSTTIPSQSNRTRTPE